MRGFILSAVFGTALLFAPSAGFTDRAVSAEEYAELALATATTDDTEDRAARLAARRAREAILEAAREVAAEAAREAAAGVAQGAAAAGP